MKFSVSHLFLFFSYLFIYLFIYLFRAANVMHNINIIHWSFFPTALPHRLPFLFLALPFLALPNSLPCLFPWPAHAYFLPPMPTSYAYFLCLLPVSLPCLIPCPAYFLDLPMPTSFCLCLLLCLFPLPVSFPCLLLCPAYFLSLPFPLPCLLPCPTYRSTFFYECMLHGYIASLSLLIALVCIYVWTSSVDTLTFLLNFFIFIMKSI